MKKPYSIWWAEYPYDEYEGGKTRPVLVIDQQVCKVLCLKMTSQPPQTQHDFQVPHWKEANLPKETVIKTNKSYLFNEDDLTDCIGQLHSDDVLLLLFKYLTFK
jgi:mRNA-degrading endonuclease toxin of MazEF toxin-antitoxin module